MQVLITCSVPDDNFASHAILDVDLEMIQSLRKKISLANKIALMENNLKSLQFDSFPPMFVKCNIENLGLSDDEFDELENEGCILLPEKLKDHEWDRVAVTSCFLMVRSGDKALDEIAACFDEIKAGTALFYWFGYNVEKEKPQGLTFFIREYHLDRWTEWFYS
ncbi:MAG: hypothetical protein ACE5H1_08535 [Thermodesulfobacteriota bacterium]